MTPQDAALLASLTGFTPGPWRVRPDPEHGMPTLSLSSGGYDIATLWHGYLAADSDAALIAAAPDLHRIATEHAVEIERLRSNLAQVVDALGMAIKVYDDADLASAEPVETTDAINYCRVILQFHSKAAKP